MTGCGSRFVYAGYTWPCANISGAAHAWHRTALPHVFAEPGFLPLLEWLTHEQAAGSNTAPRYPGPIISAMQP